MPIQTILAHRACTSSQGSAARLSCWRGDPGSEQRLLAPGPDSTAGHKLYRIGVDLKSGMPKASHRAPHMCVAAVISGHLSLGFGLSSAAPMLLMPTLWRQNAAPSPSLG